MSLERVKERITKMLRLSESETATDGEVNTALEMASRLMSKHNIEREDIDTSHDSIDVSKVVYGKFSATLASSRLLRWENALNWFMTEFFELVQCYQSYKGRKKIIVFYGPEDDARMAAELYSEIHATIITLGRMKHGGYARGNGADYCEGFVAGLRNANDEAKHREEQERVKAVKSGSTALIHLPEAAIAEVKKSAKDFLVEEFGIRLSSGGSRSRRTRRRDVDAYSDGHSDGTSFNPSKQSSEPKKSQALIG